MATYAPQKPHPTRLHRIRIALIAVLLVSTHLITACAAQQGQFDTTGQLSYGDLQVTLVEVGFDRTFEGFICDDSDFRHPFVTLQLTCADDATDGCYITATLAVKYENGASWGKTTFSASNSTTDFQPITQFLQAGVTKEITFRPNSAVRQCWSIQQSVKRITLVLRDETGELKNLQAIYQP